MRHTETREVPGEQAPLLYAIIPYKVRVSIEREARRYAGYQWGATLSNEFLQTMEKSQNNVMADVTHLIAKQDDPRRAEVKPALRADVIRNRLLGGDVPLAVRLSLIHI